MPVKSRTRWESTVFACNPGTKPNLQELLKFTYTDGRISTLAGEIEAAKCIYKSVEHLLYVIFLYPCYIYIYMDVLFVFVDNLCLYIQ